MYIFELTCILFWIYVYLISNTYLYNFVFNISTIITTVDTLLCGFNFEPAMDACNIEEVFLHNFLKILENASDFI